MKMVTEDYVSFETAKLLKEKGFECEKDSIAAMYNEIGKFHPLSTAVDEYYYDYNDFDEYDYVAPTLQMAVKWLREVHNKQCNIELNFCSKWHFLVVDTKVTEIDHYEEMKSYPADNSDGFSSYEEAAEAAIKYCLKNLI